jgi:Holliday junction resolvase
MSELFVCFDLLKNGYSVFRSVSPSCFCDVIAIKDGIVKKFEIRTVFGELLFESKKTTIKEVIESFMEYTNALKSNNYESFLEFIKNSDIENHREIYMNIDDDTLEITDHDISNLYFKSKKYEAEQSYEDEIQEELTKY